MSEEITSGSQAAEAVSSERLGERVRAMRREAGLTLERLAERAGVSRAMLSKVERGEKNLDRIGGATNVNETFAVSMRSEGRSDDGPARQALRAAARGNQGHGPVKLSTLPAARSRARRLQNTGRKESATNAHFRPFHPRVERRHARRRLLARRPLIIA